MGRFWQTKIIQNIVGVILWFLFFYRLPTQIIHGIMLVLLFVQFCAKYFGRIQNRFGPKGQIISKDFFLAFRYY